MHQSSEATKEVRFSRRYSRSFDPAASEHVRPHAGWAIGQLATVPIQSSGRRTLNYHYRTWTFGSWFVCARSALTRSCAHLLPASLPNPVQTRSPFSRELLCRSDGAGAERWLTFLG